jgi:hypothetical protein
LGVADGVDGAGGGEVEDPRASPRGIEEHRAVEKVEAEDAEVALAGASAGIKREEVVRLRRRRGGGGIGAEGREAAGLEVSREGREAVGGLGGETRELGLQPFIYYTSMITTIRSWMNG